MQNKIERPSWAEIFKTHTRPRTILMLIFGFAAGLPILLVFSTLSRWLNEAGVSKSQIGLFAWVGFAYTVKFLWAPFLDRMPIPFLETKIGRRRAWMAVAQIGVACSLLAMSVADPAENLQYVAIVAILIAFCSATQDIAVDAWRIEAAPDSEQGAMAAIYQLGYRLGMILSGAGAFIIADKGGWGMAYQTLAAVMIISMLCVIFAPQVELPPGPPPARKPFAIMAKESVIDPFMDFAKRYGIAAIIILALIGTYRIPDFVMGIMTQPFYDDIGFSKTEIGVISKGIGVWVTIFGAFLGGVLVNRFNFKACLIYGILAQSLSNIVYAWLAVTDPTIAKLTFSIVVDNIAYGSAGTVLIAYMSSLTNKAFTATQYALFSSAYALPGKFFGGFSGFMVDAMGYPQFYIVTAMMGIPALILVFLVGFTEKKIGANSINMNFDAKAAFDHSDAKEKRE